MAPSYHLLPNFRTVPPPDGPLKLGTLITDLENHSPINYDAQVEIPEDKIQRFHVEGFTATRAKMLKGEMGVWAKVVAMEGIGVDVNWSVEGSSEFEFNFQGLDTVEFNPTPGYMAECMQLAEVQEHFDYLQSKPAVFLVTGLMIAREPSVSTGMQKGWNIGAKVGIGSLDTVGSQAKLESRTTQSVSFSKSDDFVVAVKLRKLWYKRTVVEALLGKEGKLADKHYNKGSLLGIDEVKGNTEDIGYEEVTIDEGGTMKSVDTSSGREVEWVLAVRS